MLGGEGATARDDLAGDAVTSQSTSLLCGVDLSLGVLAETEFLGHDDSLSAGELHLASSEGLLGVPQILRPAAQGVDLLADLDSGDLAVGLAVGVPHTGLKSISAGAGEHLVDSGDVPRVDSASQMEVLLSGELDHIFVGLDPGGLEGLGGELLLLEGEDMEASRELVPLGGLAAAVVDLNLRVRDTAVVAGLGVRLVLAVSVTARRSSSHFEDMC